MKYTPKLFIETSVFNFYFEGKQGQKQKDAIRLFEEIAKGRYEAYTSQTVMKEIKDASREKFEKMKALSQKYIKGLIFPPPEAVQMAGIYVKKGIVPSKYKSDALHIATAVVSNFDFVVSYNQGHIEPLQNSVSFAEAMQFLALRATKHAFFNGCSCNTEVLQEPL
jgi:predicted nucleic acid-binding protein